MTEVEDTLACSGDIVATSSNTPLIPLTGIVFTGTMPSCQAILTPVDDGNGNSTIQFTVTDTE